MDIWTEHSNICIYGGKICTYKCAPNQEHTNQWFNGWNIVMHRYMAQSLEHIDVQQKVTLKNMVSRMEYLNIHIYGFTFWNVDLSERLSLELDQYSLGRKFLFQAGLVQKTSKKTSNVSKGTKRKRT